MTTVFKYPVEITDNVFVEMPVGAEILCVQLQRGVPCIWAKVDPKVVTSRRRFRWAGTGHPLNPERDHRYVGTVQMEDGALVFHLFEVLER